MKTILLLLALCVSATAAPVLPVVKRPQPLLSPKHASVLKAAPMVKRATLGGSMNPRLPMKAYSLKVNSPYGAYECTAEALQPANQSVLFEMSADMMPGSWVTLAWFGPYPSAQQVFVMVNTDAPVLVIRATAGVAPSATMSQVVAMTPGIWVNPDVRRLRAWCGIRK